MERNGKYGMKMQLSIIIPIYNTEKYLRRCVDGILNADFSDYEILLIDDGSTDGSGAICDAYAKEHSFITAFHIENEGVSKARNYGLSKAKGECFFFVDSDDVIEKEGLKHVMDVLQSDAEAQMACFGFTNVYEDGRTKKRVLCSEEDDHRSVQGKDVLYQVLNGPGYVWNKIFKKSLIQGITFDESLRYGEDTLFVFQALEHCEKAIVFHAAPYRYFCERTGNVTAGTVDERSLEYLRINRSIFEAVRNTAPTVGMSRCFTAAKTVLSKIPRGSGQDAYYREVKKTIRFKPGEWLAYLKDGKLRESKKQRVESLGVTLFPRLIVWINGRKHS